MSIKNDGQKTSDRIWSITGTNIFGKTKEELKPQRKEFNKASGVDENGVEEKYVPMHKWPHQITKGPDHPNFVK